MYVRDKVSIFSMLFLISNRCEHFYEISTKNGGSAFLIMHSVCIFIYAFPMVYLELGIAQFRGKGFFKIWEIYPVFRGIGYYMGLACLFRIHISVIEPAVNLLILDDTKMLPLPWTTCNNYWNSHSCKSLSDSFSEYIYGYILNDDIHGSNFGLNFKLYGKIVVLYGFCFFILILRVGSLSFSSKVITFLRILFSLILITCVSFAEYNTVGLFEHLSPDFTKLRDPLAWFYTLKQISMTYGISEGVLHIVGSHIDFHSNTYVNSAFHLFSCMLDAFVHSAFLARVKGSLIERKVTVDFHVDKLKFIKYSLSTHLLAASFNFDGFWSAIFAMYTILASIGRITLYIEVLISFIDDINKFSNLSRLYKILIRLGVICFFIVTSIPLASKEVLHSLQLFKIMFDYSNLLIGFIELIVITWLYGYKSLLSDFQFMTGIVQHKYLNFMWTIGTPLMYLFGMIMFAFAFNREFNTSLSFHITLGMLIGTPLFTFLLGFLCHYAFHRPTAYYNRGDIKQWGPQSVIERVKYHLWKVKYGNKEKKNILAELLQNSISQEIRGHRTKRKSVIIDKSI